MSQSSKREEIEAIRGLCKILSGETVTMAQLSEALGATSQEERAGLTLLVTPPHSFFSDASVATEAEEQNSTISDVTLKINANTTLTLDELEDTFGKARPIPRLPHDATPRAAFYPDIVGKPYTCAIIASFTPQNNRITKLTLRRDIRLED